MDAPRPDPAQYMLYVARTTAAVAYKTHVFNELALEPGLVVADIGCGPGTDLRAMADGVAPGGLVLGIDRDSAMLRAARCGISAGMALMAGDGHQLPLGLHSVDRIRIDRALQHMMNPRIILSEIFRVLRPKGLAVIAEPDWGTLVIDAPQSHISAQFVEYTCRKVVRNAVVGREVARLGSDVGFTVRDVVAFPTVVRDFAIADKIFGLARNAEAAVDAGYLDPTETSAWLDNLRTSATVVAVTLFVTTLSRPGHT